MAVLFSVLGGQGGGIGVLHEAFGAGAAVAGGHVLAKEAASIAGGVVDVSAPGCLVIDAGANFDVIFVLGGED